MSYPLIPLTIQRIGGLADGMAAHLGKPVFVPKSSDGDQLTVRILRENADGFYGEIAQLHEAGPMRQPAPCPHFDQCGGCALQHLLPEHYHAFKQRLLNQTLQRVGYDPTLAQIHWVPAASRRRVEWKILRDGGAPRLAFHRPKSHDLVAISECGVLTAHLQSFIVPITSLLPQWPQSLRTISLTQADTGTEMVMNFQEDQQAIDLPQLAETLGLNRIVAHFSSGAPDICQRNPLQMQLGDQFIDLPVGAFLQPCAEGQSILTKIATEATFGATHIADLFCGIGTYSLPMLANAPVHAVEGDKATLGALQTYARRHATQHLSTETRDLFTSPLSAKELAKYDAVVLNPPRAGAAAQCTQLARSTTPKVVMISCNPSTFIRDAQTLIKSGFQLVSAHGIDQFIYSAHLEVAALFERAGI